MLRQSKGNMYDFVTHTWNTIKGECPFSCKYCYMKRFPQKPVHFDRAELKTNLGNDNFIFVGSSCDMFAQMFPELWILETLWMCQRYDKNKYLFQSKDPHNMSKFLEVMPKDSVVCTTIETNRSYKDIWAQAPFPESRARYFAIDFANTRRYVTIEPIIDFDINEMVELIKRCEPEQVNIGADSGNNHLPEPTLDKVLELVYKLKEFTKVAKKRNLERLFTEQQGSGSLYG